MTTSNDSVPGVADTLPASDAPDPIRLPRLLLGFVVGAVLALVAFEAASLAPRHLASRGVIEPGVVPDESGVTLSFVETARGRVWGPRLAQGMPPGFRDVAIRVAVIEHPDGIVLFGTGVAPGRAQPSMLSTISNPFGRLSDVRSVLDVVPADRVAAVILPSLRWYHLGAVDELNEVPVFATGSEVWAATEGPWPRRFATDAERASTVAERTQRLPMRPIPLIGEGERADVFGDGTVLVTGVRGSSYDELVAVVTTADGAHTVLVADGVWVHESVADRAPRPPAAIWLHDRSWRSAARLVQVLHGVEQAGWTVVPLFDGELDLPAWQPPGAQP